MKTYSELILIPTFIERYRYLRTAQNVGDTTFGGARWLNQTLYASKEWKEFKREMIIRDSLNTEDVYDLALEGYPIRGAVYLHHINPLTKNDVLKRSSKIFNPENVICVSFNTHQAIHFGNETLLPIAPPERKPNDTCPWR